MDGFFVISLLIVIVVLAVVLFFVWTRYKIKISQMISQAKKTDEEHKAEIEKVISDTQNEIASHIEALQGFEQQNNMMLMVDEITLSLLGMPDNDLEQFDSHLLNGLQTIAQCGECHAISVYRNKYPGDEPYICTKQFSWETDLPINTDDNFHEFSYKTVPELYEHLEAMQPANALSPSVHECVRESVNKNTKSVLIIPVTFQNRFWGTVWYEDFNSEEPFSNTRLAILNSAALVLVSAVHRRRQAVRIFEAAHRMRLMLDATPLCCLILNKSGSVIDANTTALNFFGFNSQDELKARFPEANPETKGYLQNALENEILKFEWTYRLPKTGESIHTETEYVRVDYDGEHVIAAYIRDIREHRRMLNEVKMRGHLLYIVNEAASTLLQAETDNFDTALYKSLSRMAEAVDMAQVFVWKYSEEELLFTRVHEWVDEAEALPTLMHPSERQQSHFCNETVFAGSESRLFRGLCLSGRAADLPQEARDTLNLQHAKSYIIVPIIIRKKLWGILGFGDLHRERTFSDSVESSLRSGGLLMANAHLRNEMTRNLEKTALELETALDDAKAASRAKTNFLSTMSHEMRTPMNAIIGMSTLGRNDESLERKNYSFDRISDASKHLLGVINDVLDMSKIEADMLTLSPELSDINNIIDTVMVMNKFRIEEKNQKFTLKIDENIPTIIIVDSHRLVQVLTNLLSNAIKFTDDHREVQLDAKLESKTETDCQIRFTVTDEGIGLSAEQQAKLFRAFMQAENDTSRKYGGTGLGLAISKRIVELMGGNIDVQSEPGKGSVFSFTINAALPNMDELHECAIDENILTETNTFPNRRILLVEDIEVNREIVLAMLEDSELEITCAVNGEEAVEKFAEAPSSYDLIFMDVHMPIMDGYTATEEIRKLPHPHAQDIPIIAMTANVFREDVEKCIAAGMTSHLGKPLDFTAVRGALRKYL